MPVTVPPVLLEGPSAYPAQGYQILLDRGALGPRLTIEALQGRVVLRMLVQADGAVARVEIAESSGHDVLDRAAAEGAWSWRFSPAARDGTPIDAWVLIPVRFVVR